MSSRRGFDFKIGGRQINPLVGILFTILFLVGLFMLARAIFRILYFLSPLILIATLVIDYKVVLGYIQTLINLTKRNAIVGIGAILLTVFGFPVVAAFLLGKALFNRKVRQIEKERKVQKEGELVDFEELDSKPLDLDRLKQAEKRRSSEEYDQFFEE